MPLTVSQAVSVVTNAAIKKMRMLCLIIFGRSSQFLRNQQLGGILRDGKLRPSRLTFETPSEDKMRFLPHAFLFVAGGLCLAAFLTSQVV